MTDTPTVVEDPRTVAHPRKPVTTDISETTKP